MLAAATLPGGLALSLKNPACTLLQSGCLVVAFQNFGQVPEIFKAPDLCMDPFVDGLHDYIGGP